MSSVAHRRGREVAPIASGTASTAMMRGRCARGTGAGTRGPARRGGGGQDDRGRASSSTACEPVGVTGEFRREQGHRDGAGLDRGEEADDVVDALRGEDRDPVAGLGDLLEPCSHRAQPGAERRPGQLDRAVVVEVEIPVGGRIARLLGMAIEERRQRDSGRNLDIAFGIEIVVEPHLWTHKRIIRVTPGKARRRRPRSVSCRYPFDHDAGVRVHVRVAILGPPRMPETKVPMSARSSETSRYTETERKFDVVESTVSAVVRRTDRGGPRRAVGVTVARRCLLRHSRPRPGPSPRSRCGAAPVAPTRAGT